MYYPGVLLNLNLCHSYMRNKNKVTLLWIQFCFSTVSETGKRGKREKGDFYGRNEGKRGETRKTSRREETSRRICSRFVLIHTFLWSFCTPALMHHEHDSKTLVHVCQNYPVFSEQHCLTVSVNAISWIVAKNGQMMCVQSFTVGMKPLSARNTQNTLSSTIFSKRNPIYRIFYSNHALI